MHEDPLLQRITVNPGIFGGKPIIRGRRLAVETVLGMLAVGDTMETLLEGYPWLEREDILACLAFAQDEADVVSEVSVNEASPMTARVEPQDPSPRDREGVLSALRDLKREWRDSIGIEEMGVFGSFARGSATEASDLDIYVKTRSPNPYLLVHLKEAIEGRVHRKVDIVRLRERMNPLLRRRIEQEGIDV